MKNIMSNILLIALVAFIGTSMTSSLHAEGVPSGKWKYTVKNTPNGDSNGVMIIEKTPEGYTGKVETDQFGELTLKNARIVNDQFKAQTYIASEYAYAYITLNFEKNKFKGTVEVDGENLTISGERVKDVK